MTKEERETVNAFYAKLEQEILNSGFCCSRYEVKTKAEQIYELRRKRDELLRTS